MESVEALRSISNDLVEYIQKEVGVDFDNAAQAPLSFYFAGKQHLIGEVLGRFGTGRRDVSPGFLVCAENNQTYFLYFQPRDPNRVKTFQSGCWVLCFRILRDEELMAFYREDRKMLVHMSFKRIVDFHGHLCPDLVLGGKACQYVQELILSKAFPDHNISIIAENCTSALDAIQIMLGATVGNQRLQIMDYGKHNYTIIGKNGQNGVRLSLCPQFYGDEEKYNALERKIIRNQMMLDEMVCFQELLDCRVKRLLSLSHQDLFKTRFFEVDQKPTELASVYLICSVCEEQVLKSRAIEHKGAVYCVPCFQRTNIGSFQASLQ